MTPLGKLALVITLALTPPAVAGPKPDRDTLCGIGRGMKCDLQQAIDKGLSKTGLRPVFPKGANCRKIDEKWAIDYTSKRNRPQLHGGIDIPAPYGTPIVAVADGEVIAVYTGENSYRGREIVLRHSPKNTGLPVWIFTQYSHFDAAPKIRVGQRVKKGQVLGPTGNSGRGRIPNQQSKKRRPAIHFATYFSTTKHFVNQNKRVVVPVNGFWMDPNNLYRGAPPFDSPSLKSLPRSQKRVSVPVIYTDGSFSDESARIIWPYHCSK